MPDAKVKSKGRIAARIDEFRAMSGADKRRTVTDLLFNNAMYIIILIAIVYIAIQRPAFLYGGGYKRHRDRVKSAYPLL